ncbi:hypothetical protein ACLKA7_007848 [Drosophila subpalustris]
MPAPTTNAANSVNQELISQPEEPIPCTVHGSRRLKTRLGTGSAIVFEAESDETIEVISKLARMHDLSLKNVYLRTTTHGHH